MAERKSSSHFERSCGRSSRWKMSALLVPPRANTALYLVVISRGGGARGDFPRYLRLHFTSKESPMKTLLAGALLALGVAASAAAQTFPARVVRVIVPFPPGGGIDVLVRAMAVELTA